MPPPSKGVGKGKLLADEMEDIPIESSDEERPDPTEWYEDKNFGHGWDWGWQHGCHPSTGSWQRENWRWDEESGECWEWKAEDWTWDDWDHWYWKGYGHKGCGKDGKGLNDGEVKGKAGKGKVYDVQELKGKASKGKAQDLYEVKGNPSKGKAQDLGKVKGKSSKAKVVEPEPEDDDEDFEVVSEEEEKGPPAGIKRILGIIYEKGGRRQETGVSKGQE